jgi:hypothetical protein
MADSQAVGTYKTPFYETHLPESLPIKTDFLEFPELSKFRKLKNRYHERPILIEIPPEEKVTVFLPEMPLKSDVDLVCYLSSNNKKLLDAGIGVRQCHCCKPEENLHLVGYKENESGLKEKIKLANIGGRNGDSCKMHSFLFETKDYECFGDYICPTHFNKYRIERFNITTA